MLIGSRTDAILNALLDILMNSHRISNLIYPIFLPDVATTSYIDTSNKVFSIKTFFDDTGNRREYIVPASSEYRASYAVYLIPV